MVKTRFRKLAVVIARLKESLDNKVIMGGEFGEQGPFTYIYIYIYIKYNGQHRG